MQLQLIEVYSPEKELGRIDRAIRGFSPIAYWVSHEPADHVLIRILVKTEDTEDILNYFEEVSHVNDDVHALLFPVQTYIPRIDKEERDEKGQEDPKEEKELKRASRQELYGVIESSSKINVSYTWLVFLSSVVATAGIIKNSPAIVIGAMVIAPLLGPVISISFASVLGDYPLVRRAVLTFLYGLSIPFGIAVLFGYFFSLPVYSDEFLSRTNIEIIDIIAALASGAAGALSFVKRLSDALVGVMVAVALLPPTIILGMTLGASSWQDAVTPLLLLLVNVNSVLLSAILMFRLGGIKPIQWQDIQRANISRKFSLLFIGIISVVLAAAIIAMKMFP